MCLTVFVCVLFFFFRMARFTEERLKRREAWASFLRRPQRTVMCLVCSSREGKAPSHVWTASPLILTGEAIFQGPGYIRVFVGFCYCCCFWFGFVWSLCTCVSGCDHKLARGTVPEQKPKDILGVSLHLLPYMKQDVLFTIGNTRLIHL